MSENKNAGGRACRRCVATTYRPGLELDEDGICFPCRVSESSSEIDWEARRSELELIAEWGRSRSQHPSYDCIVAVSGGKDSTRQALMARELGLRPLLVSQSNPPEHQTAVGANNISNLVSLGFDTIQVSPSPKTWKRLARNAFFRFGNYGRATEMALYATTPRVATAMQIPLIFLGENNALTYGDKGGSLGGDANQMKYNSTLSGGDPSSFLDSDIDPSRVIWHHYPSDEELQRANIRIVYLGFYFKDFNNFENQKIAVENGLALKPNQNPIETGSIYNNDALDDDMVHVNQMIKFLKFGFAKVTDEMAEAIRLGLIDRDKAIDLVEKFDGKCADQYINKFCTYFEITEAEFWSIAEKYRNTEIWSGSHITGFKLNRPQWN